PVASSRTVALPLPPTASRPPSGLNARTGYGGGGPTRRTSVTFSAAGSSRATESPATNATRVPSGVTAGRHGAVSIAASSLGPSGFHTRSCPAHDIDTTRSLPTNAAHRTSTASASVTSRPESALG